MACTEFTVKSLTATILLPHFYSMIKPPLATYVGISRVHIITLSFRVRAKLYVNKAVLLFWFSATHTYLRLLLN